MFENSDLHRKAERILSVLAENDGEANTSEIRHQTGLSSALIGHHTQTLSSSGLIQKNGTVDVGAPVEANQWGLTDAGRGIAESLGDPLTPSEYGRGLEETRSRTNQIESRLTEVEERLGVLESQFDQLDVEVVEQGSRLDAHKETLDTLVDVVKKLRN